MLDALPYETNFNPTAACVAGATAAVCLPDPIF